MISFCVFQLKIQQIETVLDKKFYYCIKILNSGGYYSCYNHVHTIRRGQIISHECSAMMYARIN